MMQSKAMEDFRKNNINSSNFVLQLPANYSQTDHELTGNTVLLEMYPLTIESYLMTLHINTACQTRSSFKAKLL